MEVPAIDGGGGGRVDRTPSRAAHAERADHPASRADVAAGGCAVPGGGFARIRAREAEFGHQPAQDFEASAIRGASQDAVVAAAEVVGREAALDVQPLG